ncbi:hypothetical protein ACILDU_11255 [Capnocytophaga canimorsus]|uniref:hypothetical protein n=1 Tax=Capnocytophaga canimorsus TaxID=28188 RepID=UPI0037D456D8
MAKKEITRGVFSIDKLVDNVKDINKKLAGEPDDLQPKTYNIYLYVDEKTREKIDTTFAKYLYSVRKLGAFPKKKFFRLMLEKYKSFLEEQNLYIVNENREIIKNLIGKGGRRLGKTNSKSILFGTYQDDTLEIFENVAYSIAYNEQMKNVNDYKKEYFVLKILDYFTKNIDRFIKEANKK